MAKKDKKNKKQEVSTINETTANTNSTTPQVQPISSSPPPVTSDPAPPINNNNDNYYPSYVGISCAIFGYGKIDRYKIDTRLPPSEYSRPSSRYANLPPSEEEKDSRPLVLRKIESLYGSEKAEQEYVKPKPHNAKSEPTKSG